MRAGWMRNGAARQPVKSLCLPAKKFPLPNPSTPWHNLSPMNYCPNSFGYARRLTREVLVGPVGIGGANPIRLQSMLTCDTMDTDACVRQTLALVEVGCEIVRITAPTVKDAANLQVIVQRLRDQGCNVPIVADIHFKPEAALEAARWVEKVRINPGNYADSKKFKIIEYSDEQYLAELERIRERFAPLVALCKERGVAMRIGTNHGSLSDRIMNRYGDTPLGMVESALEFARIARDMDYHAFVFSMKASNPKVMINAYRLLVARLNELGPDWNYPIHLGVTEAGDGEDGRIKSAIGIGSLLHDGIGDTIRVSLTEDSVHEIPVARALASLAPASRSFEPTTRRRRPPRARPAGLPRRRTIRVAIPPRSLRENRPQGPAAWAITNRSSFAAPSIPRDDQAVAAINGASPDAKLVTPLRSPATASWPPVDPRHPDPPQGSSSPAPHPRLPDRAPPGRH